MQNILGKNNYHNYDNGLINFKLTSQKTDSKNIKQKSSTNNILKLNRKLYVHILYTQCKFVHVDLK